MFFHKLFLLVAIGLINHADFGSSQSTVCPTVRTSSGWLDLFPLPCKKNTECRVMGTQHLCCNGFCTKGVKPLAAQRVTKDSKSSVVDLSSSSPSTSTSTSTTSTSTSTSTTTTSTTTPSTTSAAPTTTTTTTTTTQKPTTEAILPFFQLLPIQSTKATINTKITTKSIEGKPQKLVCPKQAPVILFPIPCEKNSQCRTSSGADHVCCDGRCVRGVKPPRPTPPPISHQPLLGVIPRECPAAPLGELLFEVQTCKTDADCWPRVCCPDGQRSYCRTARARLDLVPIANQIDGPVRMLEKYLQCTPPPQFDLFPQRCSSSVDCFPNLCCAEGGNKHCRPPQRSLIALLAGVTQRVGSTIGSLRQAQANN